jgi:hypothetical protein
VAVGGEHAAEMDFGARISAWRLFNECRADVCRGLRGDLSCRSSFIRRAGVTFPDSGIG